MSEKLYCGKGKVVEGKFGNFMKLNLCISDIPAEFKDEARNGKLYTRLNISRMKNPDNYGNTHTVTVDTWKPEQKPVPEPEQQDFTDDIPF